MRFLHIGDLHIGKKHGEHRWIDEQRHAFAQLIDIAGREEVDAVLVAGDVFDRTQPPREALEMCEELYTGFLECGAKVFVVPGNHDSAQQVAFCSKITEAAGLYVAKAYSGEIQAHRLEKGGETAFIHLLPFVRPTDVRMALPERAGEVGSHDDAVRIALEEHALDRSAVNVLVAHQFVTDGGDGPQTCDSESISVGGIDNVLASNFDAFDYVALGHLHGPQHVRRPEVRYCGSPVRYSFSEAGQRKVALIVDIAGGAVSTREVELEPIHRMREITMSYEELRAGADSGDHEDYMHVTLTDSSLYDAGNKVRELYPNLLKLDWAQAAEAGERSGLELGQLKELTLSGLFAEFYESQTGAALSKEALAMFEEVVSGKGGDAQ